MSPIFTYQCNSCGHEYDEIRSYDPENNPIECPHCETLTGVKLPSAPSQARGAFGTVHKKPSKNTTPLNFSKKKGV